MFSFVHEEGGKSDDLAVKRAGQMFYLGKGTRVPDCTTCQCPCRKLGFHSNSSKLRIGDAVGLYPLGAP
eukprot:scaffold425_cov175-Amphora_coffeaeformis.AAC.84